MPNQPRNPFEVMIVGAFGLYCLISLAVFDKVATTTLRNFPWPWAHLFLATALVACGMTLTGIVRQTVRGVLVERAGLSGLTGITFMYAVWSLTNSGVRGMAFALLLGAICVSSLLRSRQIGALKRKATER
jgi:hypothetical protein